MKKNNLLLNREYNVQGTWYKPSDFLYENFKSVVRVELIDTTSSAGDWSGMIVQKINKTYYLIIFTQEVVDIFSDEYIIRTSDFAIKCNNAPSLDEIREKYIACL